MIDQEDMETTVYSSSSSGNGTVTATEPTVQTNVYPDVADRRRGNPMVCTAPGFIQNYFASSRLHHLSTWKSDLIEFVMLKMEKDSSKRASKSDEPYRTIMHVDMDCFFASVATRERPDLKDKPVAIAHSTGAMKLDYSSSEIASCNYKAREYGLKNGMFLGAAKSLAPDLVIIPYDFKAYDDCSRAMYDVLLHHSSYVQAVSCDEAYIDVTLQVQQYVHKFMEQGEDGWCDYSNQMHEVVHSIANLIRGEVFTATSGCHASIGISYNLLLARLATDKAKPAGVYYIAPGQESSILRDLQLRNLPGVGWATTQRLEELNIRTCQDLRQLKLSEFPKDLSGKIGETLIAFANGIDQRVLENKERESIGSDINWGIRFKSLVEIESFLLEFTREVYRRLEKNKYTARHVTVKVKKKLYAGEPGKYLGCGHCDDLSKSILLKGCVKSVEELSKIVLDLFYQIGVLEPDDIRGVGIHLKKLERLGNSGAITRDYGIKSLFLKQSAVDNIINQSNEFVLPHKVDEQITENITDSLARSTTGKRTAQGFFKPKNHSNTKPLKNVNYASTGLSIVIDEGSNNCVQRNSSVDQSVLSCLPLEVLKELLDSGTISKQQYDDARKDCSLISNIADAETKLRIGKSTTDCGKQIATSSTGRKSTEKPIAIAKWLNASKSKRTSEILPSGVAKNEETFHCANPIDESSVDWDFLNSLPEDVRDEQIRALKLTNAKKKK